MLRVVDEVHVPLRLPRDTKVLLEIETVCLVQPDLRHEGLNISVDFEWGVCLRFRTGLVREPSDTNFELLSRLRSHLE